MPDLLSSDDILLMLIGFAASFIVAMIAVVNFIKLIKRLRLEWFALYRFVLASNVSFWRRFKFSQYIFVSKCDTLELHKIVIAN
ncbi:undecaprenyl-diphosphate phosphatase [Paenibacillus sp. FSL R7-0312]|uniref:undecaprenyl-diphosphate phosphatase n=1 Tax=Paenibacillus sp. FSL R7-0312 TaxID=2921682 RepID=UPI0030F9B064